MVEVTASLAKFISGLTLNQVPNVILHEARRATARNRAFRRERD